MLFRSDLDSGSKLMTQPVNACIQLLPMLRGEEVVTVGRLASPAGALHPVQAALSDYHGSQCGFCTPAKAGFQIQLRLRRFDGLRLAPE